MRPQKCAREDVNYHQFADLVMLLFFHVMVALNCFDFEYAADFMLPCLFLDAILTTVHCALWKVLLENQNCIYRRIRHAPKTTSRKQWSIKKGNTKLAEADAYHKI